MTQAKCTSCGATLAVNSGDKTAICEFCQTTNIVENALALAKVQVDVTEDLKKLRANLNDFVSQNSIDEILRVSQKILDWIPQDFVAKYYFAYAKQATGQPRFMYDFLSQPPAFTEEEFQNVSAHLMRYSDLRDKRRIVDFYNKFDSAKVSAFIEAHTKRQDVENHYANVPRDVFICFSSYNVEIAENVMNALESDGNTCWISTRNLRPNDTENYWTNIENAIKNTTLVLVIGSEDSMLSKDVQKEIELAQTHHKRIIEFKIDNARHNTLFKHVFSGVKWIEGTLDPNQYLAALCERVYYEIRGYPQLPDNPSVVDSDPIEVDNGFVEESGSLDFPDVEEELKTTYELDSLIETPIVHQSNSDYNDNDKPISSSAINSNPKFIALTIVGLGLIVFLLIILPEIIVFNNDSSEYEEPSVQSSSSSEVQVVEYGQLPDFGDLRTSDLLIEDESILSKAGLQDIIVYLEDGVNAESNKLTFPVIVQRDQKVFRINQLEEIDNHTFINAYLLTNRKVAILSSDGVSRNIQYYVSIMDVETKEIEWSKNIFSTGPEFSYTRESASKLFQWDNNTIVVTLSLANQILLINLDLEGNEIHRRVIPNNDVAIRGDYSVHDALDQGVLPYVYNVEFTSDSVILFPSYRQILLLQFDKSFDLILTMEMPESNDLRTPIAAYSSALTNDTYPIGEFGSFIGTSTTITSIQDTYHIEEVPFILSYDKNTFSYTVTDLEESSLRSTRSGITTYAESNEITRFYSVKSSDIGIFYTGSKSVYRDNPETDSPYLTEFQYLLGLVRNNEIVFEIDILNHLNSYYQSGRYYILDIEEFYYDPLMELFVLTTSARLDKTIQPTNSAPFGPTTTMYFDKEGEFLAIYENQMYSNHLNEKYLTDKSNDVQITDSGEILISSIRNQQFIIHEKDKVS
jgi:uncharacterized Zn finger protein (UPF0148 family)